MKTWIEISKENILSNAESLKFLLRPRTKLMAVVKSNAYGHGIGEVSKICVQSKAMDWFGVDSLEEALILRQQKVRLPILILGYVPAESIGEAVENDISFVAYNRELLGQLKNYNFKKRAKIHLKIETGTSRQGICGQELVDFAKEAKRNKNIIIEGAYTHFANIEDTTDSSYAKKQLDNFNKNISALQGAGIEIPLKHSACSAAIINYPETHFNMVRAGISLYGLWSSEETKLVAGQKHVKLNLKPALAWKTRVAQIKNVPAGTPISYGLTERVKRDSRVAVLPVGYWDGYDRGLSSTGEVLIRGKRAKILGRICMNMMMADVTDIPKIKLFDEAVLLGKQGKEEITAEELAGKIGTINYEIITRINPLAERVTV